MRSAPWSMSGRVVTGPWDVSLVLAVLNPELIVTVVNQVAIGVAAVPCHRHRVVRTVHSPGGGRGEAVEGGAAGTGVVVGGKVIVPILVEKPGLVSTGF